jgi:uncharacterized protein YbaA (DUF1428 family)
MGYLDGVLVAVPDERKAAYRDFSAGHAALFKEYGARRVVDAWGDDVPDGKLTDFKGAVKAQAGETVVFSWVEWPPERRRAAAWGKMMSDPRMATLEMPFDGKRVVMAASPDPRHRARLRPLGRTRRKRAVCKEARGHPGLDPGSGTSPIKVQAWIPDLRLLRPG